MYHLSGFADEAADTIEEQIRAVKELGWKHLELRAVEGVNAHDLPEEKFNEVAETVENSGVRVGCFGSNLGNWGTPIDGPFEETQRILERVIQRGKIVGTRYVRIMSYAVRVDEAGHVRQDQKAEERFRRLRIVCDALLENGLTPVHENCFNYGGMSAEHTERLIEAVPGIKLAFDTGNPPLQYDHSKPEPGTLQSSWEFYTRVKPHIAYVHIKDAVLDEATKEEKYHFPGEGAGDVQRIVKDLLDSGYEGTFAIEPHMAVVYHDSSVTAGKERRFTNFVEYGKRFMALLEKVGYEYSG